MWGKVRLMSSIKTAWCSVINGSFRRKRRRRMALIAASLKGWLHMGSKDAAGGLAAGF
jgi:hypothetical protein